MLFSFLESLMLFVGTPAFLQPCASHVTPSSADVVLPSHRGSHSPPPPTISYDYLIRVSLIALHNLIVSNIW
jgi:hypothetical protein